MVNYNSFFSHNSDNYYLRVLTQIIQNDQQTINKINIINYKIRNDLLLLGVSMGILNKIPNNLGFELLYYFTEGIKYYLNNNIQDRITRGHSLRTNSLETALDYTILPYYSYDSKLYFANILIDMANNNSYNQFLNDLLKVINKVEIKPRDRFRIIDFQYKKLPFTTNEEKNIFEQDYNKLINEINEIITIFINNTRDVDVFVDESLEYSNDIRQIEENTENERRENFLKFLKRNKIFNCDKNSIKIDIVKHILFNLNGYIFDKNEKQYKIIRHYDKMNNLDKNIEKLNDDELINFIKMQCILTYNFENYCYQIITDNFIDEKQYVQQNEYKDINNYRDINVSTSNLIDRNSFTKLIKKIYNNIEKFETDNFYDLNISTYNDFMNTHIPFFIFYFIERREEYIKNYLKSDLETLNKKIKNKLNIDEFIKCVLENIEKLNKKRFDFFKTKYKNNSDKNCFMFHCSICLLTDECPNEDEDEDANDPSSYFVVLYCGHSLHRTCAKSWIKNKKLPNEQNSNSKYINSVIIPLICPLCRQITFFYY
jgi:hypothetical protein